MFRVVVRPNVTGVAVGFTKRVAMLSSEIGMLGDSGYLSAVQALSATPSVFHEKFAEAFVSVCVCWFFRERVFRDQALTR